MAISPPRTRLEVFRWTLYIGLPIFAMWISNIPETGEYWGKYWNRDKIVPSEQELKPFEYKSMDAVRQRVEELKEEKRRRLETTGTK